MKKWIQKAVPKSHRGLFTSWCEKNGFGGVTMGCIARAKAIATRTGDKKLMGQAVLAGRFNKKGGV
jgi:hypothetical protein